MGKYNADTFNAGLILKDIREREGKDRQQFADALGITKRALESYEDKNITAKGEPRKIYIDSYLKWCDRLDCDIDYLLGVQDAKKKDVSDISSMTGLNPEVVELLKKEKERPITAEIRNGKDGVVIGITTAELLNYFSGFMGMNLKETMLQYTREKMVLLQLEKSAKNIVDHHNSEEGRKDSFEYLIQFVGNTLDSIRLMTSLSSLTVANRMQKGIEDDFTVFCKKMSSYNYSKTDCKVLFDYMHSKNRIEALKMKCYDLMMRFLDMMSEESQLKFHSNLMGDYDVTATMLYEEPLDDMEQRKNEMFSEALKRKMVSMKTKNQEYMTARDNLIEVNNQLSAELNDERQKVRELEKELKALKTGKKS